MLPRAGGAAGLRSGAAQRGGGVCGAGGPGAGRADDLVDHVGGQVGGGLQDGAQLGFAQWLAVVRAGVCL